VILILRFIGVTNAAVWLGAAVFFTLGVAPVFFTQEVKHLFNDSLFWPGLLAQVALERYFCLQYICSIVALVHQAAEWLYLGRALRRFTLGLLIGLISLSFIGGLWLQPKLRRLHLIKYGVTEQYKPAPIPAEERARAARRFGAWHGIAQGVNLIVLAGLLVYFWRVTHPNDSTRFLSATKFRS
jgi:hypothetical protein